MKYWKWLGGRKWSKISAFVSFAQSRGTFKSVQLDLVMKVMFTFLLCFYILHFYNFLILLVLLSYLSHNQPKKRVSVSYNPSCLPAFQNSYISGIGLNVYEKNILFLWDLADQWIFQSDFKTRKFYIKRKNFTEAMRIVIADLLPWIDLEKCVYILFLINYDKILSSLLNL